MNIIQITATETGSRPPIQSWSGYGIPEGYIEVPDGVDTSAMQTHMGFVDLIVDEDGVLTGITGNDEKHQAYVDSLPPETEPEPTDTDVLNTLLGVTE